MTSYLQGVQTGNSRREQPWRGSVHALGVSHTLPPSPASEITYLQGVFPSHSVHVVQTVTVQRSGTHSTPASCSTVGVFQQTPAAQGSDCSQLQPWAELGLPGVDESPSQEGTPVPLPPSSSSDASEMQSSVSLYAMPCSQTRVLTAAATACVQSTSQCLQTDQLPPPACNSNAPAPPQSNIAGTSGLPQSERSPSSTPPHYRYVTPVSVGDASGASRGENSSQHSHGDEAVENVDNDVIRPRNNSSLRVAERQRRGAPWSHSDTIALVRAKREEVTLFNSIGSSQRCKTRPERWADVMKVLHGMGVRRSYKECKKRWDNLLQMVRKITDWNQNCPAQKNYWLMDRTERRAKGMVFNVEKEVFDSMIKWVGRKLPSNAAGADLAMDVGDDDDDDDDAAAVDGELPTNPDAALQSGIHDMPSMERTPHQEAVHRPLLPQLLAFDEKNSDVRHAIQELTSTIRESSKQLCLTLHEIWQSHQTILDRHTRSLERISEAVVNGNQRFERVLIHMSDSIHGLQEQVDSLR